MPGELLTLDEKPLLGFPPPFPWGPFSSELGRSLQIEGITVSPGEVQWLSADNLFAGLGDKLKVIPLNVSPISGNVWWAMPEKGYTDAIESLLSIPPAPPGESVDESILEAFSLLLAAEGVSAFQKVDFDKKLSPVVLASSGHPAEPCLGIDISIQFKQKTVYGRLLLSSAFRKSWAARYLKDQQALALTSPIADALNVVAHLEAGKINIKPSEWQQIAPGDFIVLENCSLEPEEDKGRVMVVINGHPFFRGKIKDGSLKILEHPLYHEVETAMSTPPKDHDEDDELEEIDFDIDDTSQADKKGEESDDLDLDDLNSIKTETAPAPEPKKPVAAPAKAPIPAPSAAKSGPLTPDEIPLSVVIEVGRIQMTVKKLLELQPGNLLELDIHPESGVDMVINGKRVAKGELLRIGDTLGLRVTELA